ncbi:hypothetical protein LguiB_005331 [Lonicera macranthoides]
MSKENIRSFLSLWEEEVFQLTFINSVNQGPNLRLFVVWPGVLQSSSLEFPRSLNFYRSRA